MTWEALTVVEVEGQPPDVAFSQWVDLPAATAWLGEARRRTAPELIASLASGTWSQQYSAVVLAWHALSQFYRALNLRWYCDPAVWDVYRQWQGGYDRVAPAKECTESVSGPTAVWGRPATQYYDCVLERAPTGRTPDDRERDAATIPQVCTARGPTDFLVQNRLKAIWAALKPGGRTDFVHVVPAFLSYTSDAVVMDTRNPSGGPEPVRFDGVFTGAACANPSGVLTEQPRDSVAWNWDCIRWDDAPFNSPRLLPPLQWSLEEARAWVQAISPRGPKGVVYDARITTALENMLRAKQAGMLPDELASAQISEFERIHNQQHDPSKTRQIFETAGSLVCTAATAAGGIGGVICGGIVAGLEAIASILPLAVGCDYDQFSLPLPALLNPRISQASPPAFTIPLPSGTPPLAPGEQIIDPEASGFARLRQQMQLDRAVILRPPPAGTTLTIREPTGPARDGSLTPVATGNSSSGGGAGPIIATALGLLLLKALL